jgi:hypothetical protein
LKLVTEHVFVVQIFFRFSFERLVSQSKRKSRRASSAYRLPSC